jgi:hypothetical protein
MLEHCMLATSIVWCGAVAFCVYATVASIITFSPLFLLPAFGLLFLATTVEITIYFFM